METKLIAFHGDPAIKAKYIDRIRFHREAEHLIQGIGWDDSDRTKVRGCAVGCTLETYDHSRYPIELGLPEWLARLEDKIFEGLPAAEAQDWPESFLEAIQPGAQLESVRHKLAVRRMDRLIVLQTANLGNHGKEVNKAIGLVLTAMQQVRACHESESAESAAWIQEAADLLALLREAE